MKKKILLALLLLVCSVGIGSSQLVKEKTFTNLVEIGKMDGGYWTSPYSFISETYGLVLVFHNPTTKSIDFYKENYTPLKSTSLSGIIPTYDYGFTLNLISEKLFDTDNSFEFVLHYWDWEGEGTSSIKLCKDNGTVIQDFGDTYPSLIFGCNTYKLVVERVTGSYPNYKCEYDFYALPGTLPSCSGGLGLRSSDVQNGYVPVYPNPARENINIGYSLNQGETATLSIYTQTGALKEQRTISGTGNARINTSRYAPGVYIYKYGEFSGQFIVR